MFKSVCDTDNYETPISVWRQLLPYLRKYKEVIDPFYCSGRSKIYWEDLGKRCINSDIDAYTIGTKFASDTCIVTNPPFSCLEKAVSFLFTIENALYLLIPVSILTAPWFLDLVQNTDYTILFAVQTGYIKNGLQLRRSPTGCVVIHRPASVAQEPVTKRQRVDIEYEPAQLC